MCVQVPVQEWYRQLVLSWGQSISFDKAINHVTDKLNFEMSYLYPHFEHSCMFDIKPKILGFTIYAFWREVKGLNIKSVYNRDFTNTV